MQKTPYTMPIEFEYSLVDERNRKLPLIFITGGARSGKSNLAVQLAEKSDGKALDVNSPDPESPIDVLAKVGGYEIGGLAGATLAGAANRIPVVIDGFISSVAAHKSVEIGHRAVLDRMELTPILDLNMRLGGGTGGVLSMNLIEAGVKILSEMASFGEAGGFKG